MVHYPNPPGNGNDGEEVLTQMLQDMILVDPQVTAPAFGASNIMWGTYCSLWYERNNPTHPLTVWSASEWADWFAHNGYENHDDDSRFEIDATMV